MELEREKDILDRHGTTQFIAEIERRSQLGSASATAILAYLHLTGAMSGQRDCARAIQLCESVAATGNSYAEYVRGWAHACTGDYARAMDGMRRAGVSMFAPAAIDLAWFVWQGWGVQEPDPKVALQLLDHASALRHCYAPVMKCAFFRSGRMGTLRKILGHLLYPFALLWLMIGLRCDIYSEKAFRFDMRAAKTFFKQIPKNQ